eukprot:scaffold21153_cov116-Isochrysis_galbana.AAC.4
MHWGSGASSETTTIFDVDSSLLSVLCAGIGALPRYPHLSELVSFIESCSLPAAGGPQHDKQHASLRNEQHYSLLPDHNLTHQQALQASSV